MYTTAVFLLWCTTVLNAASIDHKLDHLCEQLLTQLPDSIQNTTSPMAVVPFNDSTREKNMGLGIAEYLLAYIHRQTDMPLVDRTNFTSVLQEMELAQSDMIDRNKALQAGKMASAVYIITGSVTPSFGSVQISAKCLHVESASIATAASVRVPPAHLGDFINDFVSGKIMFLSPLCAAHLFRDGDSSTAENEYAAR
jgi:TolB-like protein